VADLPGPSTVPRPRPQQASECTPEQVLGTGGGRPPPARDEAFDHLALGELRAYREDLAQEETRVSYCRRVLATQLIITREGRSDPSAQAAFRRALERGSHSVQLGAGRAPILAVVPADGLPQLPDLATLWRRDAPSGDAVDHPALAAALAATDQQLAAYHVAVRGRMGAATAELIARYRERPTLAVRALPLTPVINRRETRY
jgi:hypothetical protein